MPRRAAKSRKSRVEVEFTHPAKVFYPKSRFTKGDVIRYYLEIAPVLLPHFQQRPVTLKRFPDGIHGQFFYEKDAPGYTPEWVPTCPVPRRDGGEPIRYILINDARVLAWCANLGTIELHPFLHRAPAIESPTAVAFDLDPGEGADLRDCAKVALLVRQLLEGLKLEAFPKVSGSKGLQVYVPLNTPADYAATQAFAKTVAELLHREHPGLVVSEMAKAVRRAKVFVDWSQNSDFKTTVGVYSLRAKREEPYVSTPVTWDEVEAARKKRGAEALNFSPAAALARVEKHGDLFAPVLRRKQHLPQAFAAAAAAAGRPRKVPRALRAYAEKRNFDVTSEPAGTTTLSSRRRTASTTSEPMPRRSAQGSRRRFVIQKHAASHLHFDFRLEMHETLKSWAVPKGLPYALGEKHSAFATEDHPLDYLLFEGVIPAGQYGGGTVMVWDVGTYEVIEGNYWKGYLRIFLRGRKLKGEWTLKREEVRDDKARWLITKTGAAMKPLSPRREARSAVSSRSMADIAEARDAVWTSDRSVAQAQRTPPPTKASGRSRMSRDTGRQGAAATQPKQRDPRSGRVSGRARAPAPEFIEPMMARAVAELPQGDEWLYEVKWDGYRALALKHGDSVRLLSRKGNDLAKDFPGIVEAVRGIKAETAALDGEIVALDVEGRPQFQLLQNRASAGSGRIVYYAYDLLQLDNENLCSSPLETRKARLAEIIAHTDVRFSADLPGKPRQILAQASQLGLEGIVAKKRDGLYQAGERTGSWLKLKLSPVQEFVIGGFKPGRPLESLLVGFYDGKRLMFAGKVRQGLNPRNRVELWRTLEPLRQAECPFANIPNSTKSHFGEGVTAEQMKELRWTTPKVVAQVSFTEWTTSGNLRHATFLGLRTDKNPTAVVREPVASA